MTSHYSELSAKDIDSIEQTINRGDNVIHLTPSKSKMMYKPLLFSQGWKKIICDDFSSVPFKQYCFLMGKDDQVHLAQYTPNPYKDNHFEQLNIDINEDQVKDYFNFYFYFFLTDQGPIKPIHHVDDVDWQDDLSPMTRRALEQDIQIYPKIKPETDGYNVKAACIYQTSLIEVEFHLTKNGIVTILVIKSLIDDLPVKKFS